MDDAKHEYRFNGLRASEWTPHGDELLILDTQVISALQTVAQKGYQPTNAQTHRVRRLLELLHEHPGIEVMPIFGVLEGSGFSEAGLGGLQTFVVFQRISLAHWVIERGRQDPTAWDLACRARPETYFDLSEWRPDTIVREAEQVLPWTVLPGYALALGARIAHERGLEGIAALQCLRSEVIDRLEYLPIAEFLACVLLFAGRTKLRRRLRQELFKHQHPTHLLRRDAMSAAWDLGLLQLLVLWSIGDANTPLGGRHAIVVSEDAGLNLLAPIVSDGAAMGAAILDSELLEPVLAQQATTLFMEILLGRMIGEAAAAPTWDGNVAVAERLESELGLVEVTLTPTQRRISISVSGAELIRWLDVLATESSAQAAQRIVDARVEGQDLNPAALSCVGQWVHDNAAVRNRDIQASWQMVADRLPANPAENVIVGSVFHLARAIAAKNWQRASLWIGKIAAHGGAELSEIILWSAGRAVLDDTAKARGETTAKLIARIRTRLADGEAGRE